MWLGTGKLTISRWMINERENKYSHANLTCVKIECKISNNVRLFMREHMLDSLHVK